MMIVWILSSRGRAAALCFALPFVVPGFHVYCLTAAAAAVRRS